MRHKYSLCIFLLTILFLKSIKCQLSVFDVSDSNGKRNKNKNK